jgi:hypothetical protein
MFVKLEKIVDENQIIFLSSGTNSEEPSYRTFPYILKCIRDSSNDNSNEFKEITEDKYFNLNEQSTFGSKCGIATDIKMTEEGIKINFIPLPGEEGGFWADYTNVPETNVSYNKDENQLIFNLKDAKVDSNYLNDSLKSNLGNQYIKSFKFDVSENNVSLLINLSEKASQYNVKIGYNQNNMPNEEIRFK